MNHGCTCYDIAFVTGTTGMPVKNSIVWVKCLAKHTQFLLQFGLVCIEILWVKIPRVSLHYN